MRWTREHSARKADRRARQLVSDETARRTSGVLADGEVVWSWHPLLVSSSRRQVRPDRAGRAFNPRTTVAKGIRHRGEHDISRKTIAQGRPDDSGCTCGSAACFFCTRTTGASGHPAFPAPLCPENLSECANGRLRTNRPLLELSPLRPKGDRACNRARDSSGVFLNPNSCKGFEPEPSKEGSG